MPFVFVLAGLAGILGMTWFFPCVASLAYRFLGYKNAGSRLHETDADTSMSSALNLTLIIPVYNDARGLKKTLESIKANKKTLKQFQPEALIHTIVALDGCTDNSRAVAEEYPDVTVIASQQQQGKWKTLTTALQAAHDSSTWVGFVDAGAAWNENLLMTLFSSPRPLEEVGVAPSYSRENPGLTEQLAWGLERHLKSIENFAGGPISVHGATMFYRKEHLEHALHILEKQVWLNDDVVIPLALRAHYPHARICYVPTVQSKDSEDTITKIDTLSRRKRLLSGNIEWMIAKFWLKNPVVILLASRRIVRTLWAYWALFLGTGIGLQLLATLFSLDGFNTQILLGLGLFFSTWLALLVIRSMFTPPEIVNSLLASLQTPLLLARAAHREPVRWK
jgi:glycosyltransferase involved in cell wall biosynthesis